VFLIVALVLLRLSIPEHPAVPGVWLTDSRHRAVLAIALNLIPFAGIAFCGSSGCSGTGSASARTASSRQCSWAAASVGCHAVRGRGDRRRPHRGHDVQPAPVRAPLRWAATSPGPAERLCAADGGGVHAARR
jgi:hypothetical protein